MYRYEWFHAFVIILMGLNAISNGADFYFQSMFFFQKLEDLMYHCYHFSDFLEC